jgi:hypothetical protein
MAQIYNINDEGLLADIVIRLNDRIMLMESMEDFRTQDLRKRSGLVMNRLDLLHTARRIKREKTKAKRR